MEGRIFSIEEFSTFDGPGIRCTVFLKGCPLRCQWCHNPEGQLFESQILRSPNGCIHCGMCVKTGMTEASIPLCPQNLLRICGETTSAKKLFSRLETRLSMLRQVKGGITFSGGEPLAQHAFLMECLRLFQPAIHTALQTSGYCKPEKFLEVLAHTDYVLYDLKLMDDTLHRYYTGVSNKHILENYSALVHSGVSFITRIPLIPGVNDTEENLHATCRFMSELGVNEIELLPYNTSAGAKYAATGREYCVEFDENRPPHPHKELFNHYGIEARML